ncbi:hypothetical protein BC834DRAFT_966128 [Gloeopeniophorella convolvens]|nr:hypothetical protein BC834DRAFT_966128 [Gloeopeniophorella convolvens]
MTHQAILPNVSTSLLLEALLARLETDVHLGGTGSPSVGAEPLAAEEVKKLATLLPRMQTFLARWQNADTAINKLPIEVLAHIFKIASIAEAHSHPAHRIITLSLVCYHWRQTALSFPTLWNTIHLREGAIHDFQFATLCLERSKEAPLSVDISTLFRGAQISNFFSPYSSRIESVTVSVPFKYSSYSVPRFLLSTCAFPAPRLKSLRLCTAMWGSHHAPALPSLFDGDLTRITHLQVESFSPYPGYTFGNLTHLALCSQSQYEKRPSMADFLDFLEANPYLEELLLDDAGPAMHTSDSRLPVRLPNMRLLCFIATSTERAVSQRVLSHLRLPDQCCIRVHRDMDPSHLDELLPSPFPADAHLLPTFGTVENFSLRDDMRAFGERSIRCSATSRHSGVSISYRLRGPADDETWPEAVLNNFLRSIPCRQILRLCLCLRRSFQSFPAGGWRCLFERFAALDELCLIDVDMSNVLEGLACKHKEVQDVAILPALTTICLVRPKDLDMDTLLAWRAKRATDGLHISQLTIILDPPVASAPAPGWPANLPDGVQIHVPGLTSSKLWDYTFEEPLDMTRLPFGKDFS